MECREVREKIDLWKEERLSASEGAKVGRHLGDCPECRQFALEAEKIGALLREYVEAGLSSVPENAVKARVEASLREGKARRTFPGYLKWLIPVLVGAVAMLFVLFYPSTEVPRVKTFSYKVSVERVKARNASVVIVERGEDSPKVIWIIEREET